MSTKDYGLFESFQDAQVIKRNVLSADFFNNCEEENPKRELLP